MNSILYVDLTWKDFMCVTQSPDNLPVAIQITQRTVSIYHAL
jgi:hypothetical protein